MKIIIAYVSAGTGHRRAAEAIYNYFKENRPRHDLKIIDSLQKTNFIFKNLYCRGYLFLVTHALWLWHFCFWLTNHKSLRPATLAINSLVNRLNAKPFLDYLIAENPDIVISTHFLPSEIVTVLKKANKIDSRLVTVITDFGVHRYWILNGTDMYDVALPSTKELLIKEGVGEDIIKVMGIPVDSKFLAKYDKEALCAGLGLSQDKFTILISTGSSSIGHIEEIVSSLYKEVQVVTVCAGNKALYERLKKKNYPAVKVFGFIENMQELMAVSDMIIAKPGGLTISESLVMNLPPIFITAIPGQETENVRVLRDNSIGINIKDIARVRDIVMDFCDHPEKLKKMREKINELRRPFAVKELHDAVCQGSAGFAS